MDSERKILGRGKDEQRETLRKRQVPLTRRQTSHVVITDYTEGIFTVIRRGVVEPFFISGPFLGSNSLGLYEFRGKLNKAGNRKRHPKTSRRFAYVPRGINFYSLSLVLFQPFNPARRSIMKIEG